MTDNLPRSQPRTPGRLRQMDRAQVEHAIGERLADARALWQTGRRESALLLALVAVAARGKLELPDVKRNGDNFRAYLRRTHDWTIEVEFRGQLVNTDQLLYKYLRCQLAHEAGLPIDIVIDDQLDKPGALTIRAGGAPECVVRLTPAWFDFLCRVAEHPV